MRIVDRQGNPVLNLENLEPWCHFIEDTLGVGIRRSPITRIEYSHKRITIDWAE